MVVICSIQYVIKSLLIFLCGLLYFCISVCPSIASGSSMHLYAQKKNIHDPFFKHTSLQHTDVCVAVHWQSCAILAAWMCIGDPSEENLCIHENSGRALLSAFIASDQIGFPALTVQSYVSCKKKKKSLQKQEKETAKKLW